MLPHVFDEPVSISILFTSPLYFGLSLKRKRPSVHLMTHSRFAWPGTWKRAVADNERIPPFDQTNQLPSNRIFSCYAEKRDIFKEIGNFFAVVNCYDSMFIVFEVRLVF